MEFYSFDTLCPDVRRQLDGITALFRERFGDSLAGLYLHGSLALGSFTRKGSDLDLLAVTGERMPRGEREELARALLALDRNPSPVELTVLRRGDLNPWSHPALCQFHYSGFWRDRYRRLLEEGVEDPGLRDLLEADFPDPDIACHARLTRQCGVVLAGEPIQEVFPPVPEEDFWDSLAGEIGEYGFFSLGEQAAADQVILLCRVLSYRVERRILSKHGSGLWALAHVPSRFRPVVEKAMEARYGTREGLNIDGGLLEEFRRHLIEEILR